MVTNKTGDKILSKKQYEKILIRNILICLFFIAIILSIYIQVQDFEFINLDDPLYVTENPYIKQVLTQKSIITVFTTIGFWVPVTVTVLSLKIRPEQTKPHSALAIQLLKKSCWLIPYSILKKPFAWIQNTLTHKTI
jgi:hypothetical protein